MVIIWERYDAQERKTTRVIDFLEQRILKPVNETLSENYNARFVMKLYFNMDDGNKVC